MFLSMQKVELLMKELKNYPCLYDKSEKWYRERDVNRNAWSRVAERLDFMLNGIYKCYF